MPQKICKGKINNKYIYIYKYLYLTAKYVQTS